VARGATDNTQRYDAIIVLGAKVYDNGEPSPPLQERCDHAAHLYQQGLSSVIVVTGGGEPVNEAEVMQSLLLDLGIPNSAVIAECTAQSTLSNALQVRAISAKNGWQHLCVVSQRFHRIRSQLCFRACKLRIQFSACDLDKSASAEIPARELLREGLALLAYLPIVLWVYLKA